RARIAAGNRSLILLMEFGDTAQVVWSCLQSRSMTRCIQPCLEDNRLLGGPKMLFRVTGIVLLGTLALAGQTSTPALNDTEQPRPAPADIPLPSTYTFPPPKANPNLDPRIAPSPLPQSKVALVGGTVRAIDPIRNRMQVDLFGGGKMKVV